MGKYIALIYDEPYTSEHVGENIYRMVNSTKTFTATELATLFTPYTEPDMEQVRKEGYEKGWKEAEDHYFEGHSDGYDAGLDDAWKAARKIWEYNTTTLREIFGEGVMRMDWFTEFTASEAIEKIRQYEQGKEEQIQVGDEVINQNKTAVVTEITNRYTRIMYSDGSGYALFAKGLAKTGRHFPEIAAVLEKMKES